MKSAALNLAASTARIFSRVVSGLANVESIQTAAKIAADTAKENLAKAVEAVKSDWKAVASEHKDKAERKELARRIHAALQAAPHRLSSQRASDMLKVLGLDGLLYAKHQKVRVELPDGLVEAVFAFVDEKLEADGEKVKTALSRAYGKARDVYRKA